MNGYRIVRYRPNLHEAIVDLRRHAYDNDFPESRSYLEWKYPRNPWLPDPLIYVALDADGRPCGMRGAYGTRWGTPGGEVTLPCADDFSIARDHRNTGLMTIIMRFMLSDLAERGYRFVINTSGGHTTVLQSLASGWKSVGAMEPAGRLAWWRGTRRRLHPHLRGRPLVWRIARAWNAPRATDNRVFPRLDRAGPAPGRDGVRVVVDKTPRAHDMAALAAASPHDGRIRHVRNDAFFAWRFQNPARDYRFLYALRGDQVAGWLVIARHHGHSPPTIPYKIADWEGDDATRERLLRYAIAHGRFAQIGAWTGTMTEGERGVLSRAGFQPVELDRRARGLPCVLVKKLDADTPWTIDGIPLLEHTRWDVRLIDSMHA